MKMTPRILILSAVCLTAEAAMEVTELRCENRIRPIAVDAAAPRLGWVLDSDSRGERQSAYQIKVASTAERLHGETPDLWDSGKVVSTMQNQITYGGKPLAANAECHWKVRVWNEAGDVSPWSAPSRWCMGLLGPSDWHSRWIGSNPESTRFVEDCAWLWYPEADPTTNAPQGKRYFRKVFDLPAGKSVRHATLVATADNQFTAYLNGQQVGEGGEWQRLHSISLGPDLFASRNVLAIEAVNPVDSPAGLIGKLVLSFDDHTEMEWKSDGSWMASDQPHDGWTDVRCPDSGWVKARELGACGIAPWGHPAETVASLPLFRSEFTVAKPVRRAVVHVCGLGHHDLFLDGKKVGDHFLDPAWTAYEKTIFYSSHDITDQLREGRHTWALMLGKGFYNTRGDRRVHGVHSARPLAMILQAHLYYADGTEQVVSSNGHWRTTSGPITHSAILAGEDYDARAMPDGWMQPGFDDSHWRQAAEMDSPTGKLRCAYSPPLTKHDVFKPMRIDEPEAGIFVYDLGQNASAIPRIRVRGKAGQKIRLTPAEQRFGASERRNDGRGLVNPAGVGQPNYWEYTLRGGPSERWEPQFNYSGFQYIQVEGAVPAGHPNPNHLPVLEELVSVHVRSSAATIGRFECSEPLFNEIDQNIDWAVRSNLSHVLTDCPHREKLGWLEVSYLMGPSISGRYDVSGLYAKIANDCMESQRADGRVPTVAPAYPDFGDNPFTYTPEWGAAAVIVPWQVYTWYGDLELLASNFGAMRGYVDYMRNTSTDLVPAPGLGDWYDYNKGGSNGAAQFTPPELSAMATFYRCARTVAKTAALLGKTEEQREYESLADQIRKRFNAKFFDRSKGEYQNSGSPQCGHSMALVLGLVPEGFEQAVLDRIIEDLVARGNQQTAGDIGFAYLIEALARSNRHDVLHDIVHRTEMGSYGFIIRNGWTAMPEAWDANTGASMNHCMLGHIQQWFMGSVAGIRPEPLQPGFARFVISPEPTGQLTWAKGEYLSIRGRIASEWKIQNGTFFLRAVVPANSEAILSIPLKEGGRITESGKPATRAPGVKFLRRENGKAVFEVGSGQYLFSSTGWK